MKAKIVHVGTGTYEVMVKNSWFSPWRTVYSGMMPWKGSYTEAKKLVNKFNNFKK